ncbi:MAG TPA: HAD-IC family P-type ATPase, partial [Myxococcota bacterium]|nr:HAD-IC family P-type ATPase [Myxococcota bacterium]
MSEDARVAAPAGAGSDPPHALEARDVLHAWEARREGLSEHEARARLAVHGANRLHEARARSALAILVDQFRSLLVALLAVAAGLSLAFGRAPEAIAIGAVLLLNAAVGFASELRAVRSMEALRRLGHVHTRVRRDGRVRVLDAVELVPGDLVVLEGGDVVTADVRLVEASKLQADESLLTGESAPVGKATAPLAADTALAERRNMLFKGTSVTRGAGEGVVVGTGMATELGRITRLVEEAKAELTPLEKRLDRLGQRLVWLTLIVAAAIVASGIATGRDWLLTVQTGIALAVATVPEGLPIIATLALARGMHRMARRNALVNRLSAVETLGATGVIFTDKTGTLTENRMTVVDLELSDAAL